MVAVITQGPVNYPYTAFDLTEEVNRIPNLWSDLEDEGLFTGLTAQYPQTTLIEIQMRDSRVTVLEADEPGSPGALGVADTERGILLKVPHFPFTTYVRPEDLQNRFVFDGGRRRLMTPADASARRLLQIRRNQAQTLEFLRWGALQGKIITGTGSVLYDLYEAFGVRQQVFDLQLDNPAADVGLICEDIVAYIETHLFGESMTGVRAKLPMALWKKLIRHPSVEKYYIQSTNAQQLLTAAERRKFEFGGILWEANYHAVSNVKGQTVKFLSDDAGVAYPEGTEDTFRTYFGPTFSLGGANMAGVELAVSPKILDHDLGIELYSQSNPLPLCIRPELLVKIISSPPAK